MTTQKFYLLILPISTAFYSVQTLASLQQQCLVGVPHFSGTLIEGDPNEQPVFIESDSVDIRKSDYAVYKGAVEIKQGNRQLLTDQAEIKQLGNAERLTRFAYAKGHFRYQDELIHLSGTDAKINLNNKETDITNADYQLVDRQGRGTAGNIELREQYRVMKNATFTSCLPNDESWSIESAEMHQYIKEEYAEMWHARFKVHNVPVFYTPYLQLPIGDRRRSGLLIPSLGHSSRDGSWFYLPIYWNIAPNFDATFSPKYMSRRGWQLNGEFRYLTKLGQGKIAGEYLSNDRYHEYLSDDRTRHLFYWQHNSDFLDNWRLNINYTKVSDKYYFTDFSSNYGKSTDGYADQTASIAYYQPNYNVKISAKQFQVFDEVAVGPYRALPQIDFNYYRNGLINGLLDFKLYSQIIHFDNDSNLMPTAWRFHVEPTASIPLANRYGSLNIETKLYATHYQQKKGSEAKEDIKKTVNRVLPQIKVDFQTLLASKNTFIEGYTQTIEPHIQYLYRPYKNQSDIGTELSTDYVGFGYDSSLIQQDYYSLFRDRRYSGLDRIASANQFTFGGTTRFYDQDHRERFNLSLGQIYYLQASRIDDKTNNSTNRSTSSWALETNWNISEKWDWRASYQYSPVLNKTSLANTVLEYNPSGNNLIQLSYRYASKEYINQNSRANTYNQDIQQLGVVASWDLTDNWTAVAHYYQDLALKKPLEQYLGVKYNTCCWSVGVGARRYVTSRSNQKNDEVLYDNSINIKVELRGLGRNPTSGIEDMLDEGKLPYLKPFSLY